MLSKTRNPFLIVNTDNPIRNMGLFNRYSKRFFFQPPSNGKLVSDLFKLIKTYNINLSSIITLYFLLNLKCKFDS